jgi:hypothetical protein
MPKLSSMNRCSQQNYRVSIRPKLLSYTTQIMMSRYQICINDDRNLYLWKETWKEDTVADFLTRLSDSTIPRLDRQRIHLSFDGVRLGETTTMREVSAWPSWFPRYDQASLPASDSKISPQTGLEDGDELALHYGSHTCKLCTGSRMLF